MASSSNLASSLPNPTDRFVEVLDGGAAVVPEIRARFSTDPMLTRSQKPYAVTKDGQRFLVPVVDPNRRRVIFTVVLDWTTKVLK